ncbi:hypothetical protein TWF718_007080 [Orbilia javanica]|uniref:Uncharacterized protein n=1 Tax=Orbilia javanica TaxID=47235 RepID=A0AAN8N6D0_9PEZI
MPEWKEGFIESDLPLESNNIGSYPPSPSNFQNTLQILTSPFRNIYFWIWLVYSFWSNGFKRLDTVILPQPFSQLYNFLLGSTELAVAIKAKVFSIINGNATLSWLFFFFGPDIFPGGRKLFESLQYYDDWIEAYKLVLLLLPELRRLIKRVLYSCLQLVNLILKAIFIIRVRAQLQGLGVPYRRTTHLLVDYSLLLPLNHTTNMEPKSGKAVDAGLYTYQERKRSAGMPWALMVWIFIAIFSSAMLMLAILFAWDLSFFALPWCFFSISYYFRGARKRRVSKSGSLNELSGAGRDHVWAVGWMNGYREGQIQYRQKLYELVGAKGGREGEDQNYDDDQEDDKRNDQGYKLVDEGHEGEKSDYSHYNFRKQRYNGSLKPNIPDPRPPPRGLTLTDAALSRTDRALWEGDRTGE